MADLTIKSDELMVGSGHPTAEDTLNRLILVEHGIDGVHKIDVGANVSSAASITPTGTMFHITGTNQIKLISIPYAGWTGFIFAIADAAYTTASNGVQSGLYYPIGLSFTATANRLQMFIFDGTKWYPNV